MFTVITYLIARLFSTCTTFDNDDGIIGPLIQRRLADPFNQMTT